MPAIVAATNGAVVYIGTTTFADTNTEYAADTYVAIGGVNTIGPYGDQATVIPFDVIAEKRVRKAKGTYDAGTMTLGMANDKSDAGQTALIAALNNKSGFNFKIVYDDKLTASGVNTTHYFRALVAGNQIQPDGANNIVRRNIQLALDSPIYEVAAS